MAAKPKRRWLQFSMRTLFVLMTIIGVGLTWLRGQWKVVHQRKLAIEWVKAQGGDVWLSQDKRTPLARYLLGDFFVQGFGLKAEFPQEDFKRRVRYLFPEARTSRVVWQNQGRGTVSLHVEDPPELGGQVHISSSSW